MKVILVDQRHGHTRTIILKGWVKGLMSLCLLGVPVALGYFGYQLSVSHNGSVYSAQTSEKWDQQLSGQQAQLQQLKSESQQKLQALTARIASLQARLMRLDAVGERITEIADLDNGEFDFSAPVGVGGPQFDNAQDVQDSDQILGAIEQLEQQLDDRQAQLEILEGLLVDRKIQSDVFLAGRPINKGWMSSRYGTRTDPFSGRPAYHSGVDFAGTAGDDVITVAAGVVIWADEKSGYGKAVDINHGNGYITRYGHAQELYVEVGDIVKKGQAIAAIGSTGRSTGPHVHFEVHKNGRVVDPAAYIHRTAR